MLLNTRISCVSIILTERLCFSRFSAFLHDIQSAQIRGETTLARIFVGQDLQYFAIARQTAEVAAARLAIHFAEADAIQVDDFYANLPIGVAPTENVAAALVRV